MKPVKHEALKALEKQAAASWEAEKARMIKESWARVKARHSKGGAR